MSTVASPVWFITGCSTGLGHELAKLVLARGWRAAVTARDQARLASLVPGHEDRVLPLALDVTKGDQVTAAVAAAEARFGRIDVLVNNAGYGYQSSVEEGEDAEIRAQFEANVFGLFAVTRCVLPIMRRQRRGHVINISSIAGVVGFAGVGYYAASKQAVEGWSSSLAAEGKPIGIKVTCVEPGPLRTDWAGRSLVQTSTQIADYTETVGLREKTAADGNGKQPGDPVRAAEALIKITEVEEPPQRLPLGSIAIDGMARAWRGSLAEVEQWREVGLAVNFPSR